jgi:hypothetical protein
MRISRERWARYSGGFVDRDLHRARLEHATWSGIGEAIKVKAGKIVRFKAAPNLKAAL